MAKPGHETPRSTKMKKCRWQFYNYHLQDFPPHNTRGLLFVWFIGPTVTVVDSRSSESMNEWMTKNFILC